MFESTYALLTILFTFVSIVLAIVFSKGKVRPVSLAVYSLCAIVLGLMIGRTIYCAIQSEYIFYDEMGDWLGLSPFFDFSVGSASMGGILLGALLAAPLASRITGARAYDILDVVSLPMLLLYSAMRFIEPLSGQGYGKMMKNPALCFVPLCIETDWGDWMLSVCFIEGILSFALLIVLFFQRKKIRKSGNLAKYTLFLFGALQVLPECLRCDDVLYVFIFARITHIALAVMLFFTHFSSLVQSKKRGLATKSLALEAGLMLLGIIMCIGCIFALDKTNLPDLLVYAAMVLTLVLMSLLACLRIKKEDMAE